MIAAIRTIFVKEAVDLLRDRRALFFLFAMPLVMPLLGAIGGGFVAWQVLRQTRGGVEVAVVNGELLPELVARLEDEPTLRLVEVPSDVEEALRDGDLMALLSIPPDAEERLRAAEPLTMTLRSARSGWMSDFAAISVESVVDEYADDVLAERLTSLGLSRDWVKPVRLGREAVSPAGVIAAPVVAGREMPSSVGGIFLPLAIASWAFSGGLSMVAHMTVGEKERRTMEALLITPTSRIAIAVGKIALSIITSAITIGLWSLDSLAYVTLLSLLPGGSIGSGALISMQLRAMGLAVVWLVLLMLPLMTTANGVVAAGCTFAKNYREANLFLALVQVSLPGLALVAGFGVSTSPPLGVYALPVVGVLVAVRDLVGGGVALAPLMVAWGAATVYAAGAVLLAAYVFSREWALMRGV